MPLSSALRARAVTVALGLAAALATTAVSAPAGIAWSADLARSSVGLSVTQLLFSKVRGTIPITSATIVTPGATSIPERVEVTLNAGGMTTGDPQRDSELRSDKFFDVARYPTITFASVRVVGTNPATFNVEGALTMRGISRPITFVTHVDGRSTDAAGKQHVRYVAAGSFRRSDYGIVYGRGIVGNNVTLNVVIDAVNAR